MNGKDHKIPSEKLHPLGRKTVVITRPRAQSGEITNHLVKLGATVIHCPTIEIAEPDSWDALDNAIDNLEAYDWIVFTSANGVRSFARRLAQKRNEGVELMRGPVICAIGPATASVIEQAGAQVDLVAAESRAEGALKAIIEKAGGEQEIAGLRFLIPRARAARDVLPVELSRLGAVVDAVETYQTIKPDTDIESLISLFNEGRVDAITFTSPSTVDNFAALVGHDDLSVLLKKTTVACIGPVTTAAARAHKLDRIVQPEVYTATAMIEALVKSLCDS